MAKRILQTIALLTLCHLAGAETLKDAIEQSILYHPEILQNKALSLADKQAIAEAKGAYYPTIDVTGAYGRQQTASPFTIDLEGDTKITLTEQQFSINLVQNLFAGGSIVGELRRNQYSFFAQNYKTIAAANDIALKATEAYLRVILQQRLIKLAKANLAEHQRLLKLIEERTLAGVSRAAELDQAKSRVALAEANLISNESNYQEARISFKKYIGSWPEKLTDPLTPGVNTFPKTVEDGVKRGMDNHPLMKAAMADIQQSRAQYKISTSGFLPKFDAEVQVSRNQNLDGIKGKNDSNTALLRGSYNLFKGGSDSAAVRKNAFLVQQALEIRNKTLIDLQETIRLSYNSFIANKQRSTVLGAYALYVRRTKIAYFEQFQIGQRSFLDLLNTQNEEFRAETDFVTAKNDEVLARFRILNGTGDLLAFIGGNLRTCKVS